MKNQLEPHPAYSLLLQSVLNSSILQDMPRDHEKTSSTPPDWLRIVQEKVESLRFGLVQVVVHDGKVTQIESTEKTRLDTPISKPLTRSEHY